VWTFSNYFLLLRLNSHERSNTAFLARVPKPALFPPAMAEKPTPEALMEYERRRLENIHRNQAILAELRRDAADLSAAYGCSRPKRDRPRRRRPALLWARASPAVAIRRPRLTPFGPPEAQDWPLPHLRGLRRRGGGVGGGPILAVGGQGSRGPARFLQ
jgi:hypothetical protein